jgi:hypothetical protein
MTTSIIDRSPRIRPPNHLFSISCIPSGADSLQTTAPLQHDSLTVGIMPLRLNACGWWLYTIYHQVPKKLLESVISGSPFLSIDTWFWWQLMFSVSAEGIALGEWSQPACVISISRVLYKGHMRMRGAEMDDNEQGERKGKCQD